MLRVVRSVAWLAAVVALGVGTSAGCRGNVSSLSVPLRNTPKNERAQPAASIPESVKVYVEQFADNRQNKDEIGSDADREKPIPVNTNDSPAEFVRQSIMDSLRYAGVNIVDDRSQADRVISGELLNFFSTVQNLYVGLADG